MKTFLIIVAVLFLMASLYQVPDALLGHGSGILATLSMLLALIALSMAAVLDRLDKIIAKP